MARCYSGSMPRCHHLPDLWLLSDERNDALLETILRSTHSRLAFVYRHYFLTPDARRARFDRFKRIADERGHITILSGNAALAKAWGAHGYYAPARRLTPRGAGLLAVATAHDMGEIAAANRFGADALMLSPVFPTRSHPGAPTLGALRFLLMARYAQIPVIALGGMDRGGANRLRWSRWAAIDGLSIGHRRPEV